MAILLGSTALCADDLDSVVKHIYQIRVKDNSEEGGGDFARPEYRRTKHQLEGKTLWHRKNVVYYGQTMCGDVMSGRSWRGGDVQAGANELRLLE